MDRLRPSDYLRSIAEETAVGVFHCRKWGMSLSVEVLEALTLEARASQLKRARLCMHPTTQAAEQQMLIVMADDAEDAPHMHPQKREALLPIAGSAQYEIFDDSGNLIGSKLLGPGGLMYVSSPIGVYHRIVLLEPVFAFWEFTQGPFNSQSTVRAEWPRDSITGAVSER